MQVYKYWIPVISTLNFLLTTQLPAQAAKFSLNAHVAEAFSADGLFTPIPLPDYSKPVGYPAVYKIDYSVITNTAELAPNEQGFGNVAFTIVQSDGISDAFGIGWTPTAEMIDSNGALPGGEAPLFYVNVDAGPSNLDLKGILISIPVGLTTSSPTDSRILVGQNGPTYVGSTFMVWDGITPASSYTEAHDDSFPPVITPMVASFISYSQTGYFITTGIQVGPSTTLYFGHVPEPMSGISFIGIAVAGAFCRLRHLSRYCSTRR